MVPFAAPAAGHQVAAMRRLEADEKVQRDKGMPHALDELMRKKAPQACTRAVPAEREQKPGRQPGTAGIAPPRASQGTARQWSSPGPSGTLPVALDLARPSRRSWLRRGGCTMSGAGGTRRSASVRVGRRAARTCFTDLYKELALSGCSKLAAAEASTAGLLPAIATTRQNHTTKREEAHQRWRVTGKATPQNRAPAACEGRVPAGWPAARGRGTETAERRGRRASLLRLRERTRPRPRPLFFSLGAVAVLHEHPLVLRGGVLRVVQHQLPAAARFPRALGAADRHRRRERREVVGGDDACHGPAWIA